MIPSISTKNVDRTLSSNPDDAFLSSVRQLTNESKKKTFFNIFNNLENKIVTPSKKLNIT